jgi:GNAT superfamily N-acetyltransferase
MSLIVTVADLHNKHHQEHILLLTNTYALDVMGGGKPLSKWVMENMIAGLQAHPATLIFLAYEDDQPVGIANCFMGYSTFYAKPLINIHDLSVVPHARGNGVGKALLTAVTKKAQAMDCCKVTLEVLANNPARRLYEREGFTYGDPQFYFMTKIIEP